MASLKKRGDSYYVQYYLPGKIQRRVNLHTDSFQIAKEKLRRFESAQASGGLVALPTRTPLDEIVNAYVQHIRTIKKPKSAQTDIYYLRDLFGPICEALKITSRKISAKAKKRPPKPGQDRRFTATVIETPYFEQITTAQISTFISGRTQSRGLAPKTANRYREILVRLFNWAADQRGLTLPGGVNPAVKVERYKESAPQIRFLTLSQVEGQLDLLKDEPKLQAMVAVYIFAVIGDGRLLVQLPTGLAIAHNANWGMVRLRVRPPSSLVFELGEAEVRRLVGSNKDASITVTADAQRLYAAIKQHGSRPNGPLNMSMAADLTGITSKRRFNELIEELEQAGVIRTRQLLERGRPRVIELAAGAPDLCQDLPNQR